MNKTLQFYVLLNKFMLKFHLFIIPKASVANEHVASPIKQSHRHCELLRSAPSQRLYVASHRLVPIRVEMSLGPEW